MGIQLPIDPVAEDAGAFLRDTLSRPINLSEIPTVVEDVSTFLLQRAAVAAVAGEGTAAVADASVIAGAIAAILDLPWIVLGVVVIILVLVIERGLASLLGWLPFNWGQQWSSGIHHIFSPVEQMENALLSLVGNAVAGLFHGIAVVVGWGMDQNAGQAQHAAVGANSQYINYLNQRTMAEWAWLSRLQADVTALQRTLSSPTTHISPVTAPPLPEPPTVIQNTTVTQPIPQNVWDQLSHLASQNALRVEDITALRDGLSHVTHSVATLQSEFVQLSQNVHSIRALSVGLQDMQQEIETVSGLMVQFIDEASVQFEHQAHELTELAPLHLLLQTGAVGMQVLRQLQDTPCMCPRIPRLPGLTPELLAMYEFVTNG